MLDDAKIKKKITSTCLMRLCISKNYFDDEYIQLTREKAVNVTARQVFYRENSIHYPFVDPVNC